MHNGKHTLYVEVSANIATSVATSVVMSVAMSVVMVVVMLIARAEAAIAVETSTAMTGMVFFCNIIEL